LYIAPAYFIYLLRGYCFPSDQAITWIKGFKRLFTLGACVLLVFLVSFGPFLYYNQLPQVISRLFPFKRGLCHAYWAPNFWALYSFLDRVLIALGKRLFPAYLDYLKDTNLSSATRGLIGDSQFFILPNILPIHTLILTVVFQLVRININ
jgi:alpha-1,3-glucosyltransferase